MAARSPATIHRAVFINLLLLRRVVIIRVNISWCKVFWYNKEYWGNNDGYRYPGIDRRRRRRGVDRVDVAVKVERAVAPRERIAHNVGAPEGPPAQPAHDGDPRRRRGR